MPTQSHPALGTHSTEELNRARTILTIGLVLNTVAWFIPDVFFPNSHFLSREWPLHARFHAGAAATVNFVYIVLSLVLVWRPRFDLRTTMVWCALWLAVWNIVFVGFGLLVTPFIMGPNDSLINWELTVSGAGNETHSVVEGGVFLAAGVPTAIFGYVIWKLRAQGIST